MKKWIACLLVGLLGWLLPAAAMAAGQVIGNIDGFQSDAAGNPVLMGWACQVGNPASISVDLYLNQPYSAQAGASGWFVGRFAASQPSEPSIASRCGTTGASYRFAITLASNQYLAGSAVYAYGIIASGGTQISAGTVPRIPVNTQAAIPPGTVATGTPLVVYDTVNDAGAACAPLIDTPLYPLAFASPDGNGVTMKFAVLSDDGKDTNYLVSGQMNAVGSEVQPFHVSCAPVLTSSQDPVSGDFLGNQWLAGFTRDTAGNVYALVHDEYYGGQYPDANFMIPSTPGCSLGQPAGTPINALDCTYASLSVATLPAGQASFSLIHGDTPPRQVAARPSFAYAPNFGRPMGYFTNTNILLNSDGFRYALAVDNLPSGTDRRCPIRTADPTDPSSWKGWDGATYTADTPNGADCADANGLGGVFPFYVGYSTYFGKFIEIGAAPAGSASNAPAMIVYALSGDFIHWSQPVSFGVSIFNTAPATGWTGNNYPSLVDVAAIQNSGDVNASTGAIVGQQPWLVFEQHYVCSSAQDPDCPPPGRPPRTRYTAVPVGFSQ